MALYFLLYGGFLFIAGLCVGSFLNVVIDRVPVGKGLGGRSKADCCGKTLGVLDLVPAVSFLLSRGRCRYCGRKISFYYPLVELVTGILTVLAFLNFPFPYSVYYVLNFYFLVIFFFTDLKYGVVPPNVFLLNLIFILVFPLFLSGGRLSLDISYLSWGASLGAALFLGFLFLMTGGRGMAGGDVLLAFLFSLMVGFPQSLVAIFLSFILGGIASLILLVLRKKKIGQTVPFGPFLASATLISAFYGTVIFDWYLSMLLK